MRVVLILAILQISINLFSQKSSLDKISKENRVDSVYCEFSMHINGRDTINMISFYNSTKNPVYYYGYSRTSPLWKVLEEKDGEWKEKDLGGVCGYGLRMRKIPPYSVVSISLHYYSLSKGSFRFGVPYYMEKSNDEKNCWSQTVIKK